MAWVAVQGIARSVTGKGRFVRTPTLARGLQSTGATTGNRCRPRGSAPRSRSLTSRTPRRSVESLRGARSSTSVAVWASRASGSTTQRSGQTPGALLGQVGLASAIPARSGACREALAAAEKAARVLGFGSLGASRHAQCKVTSVRRENSWRDGREQNRHDSPWRLTLEVPRSPGLPGERAGFPTPVGRQRSEADLEGEQSPWEERAPQSLETAVGRNGLVRGARPWSRVTR